MNWHYRVGIHTHVRVFMNGAFCGHLTFRNEEFESIMRQQELAQHLTFIENYARTLAERKLNPGGGDDVGMKELDTIERRAATARVAFRPITFELEGSILE